MMSFDLTDLSFWPILVTLGKRRGSKVNISNFVRVILNLI